MKVVAVGDCGIDRYVDLEADRPGGISLNFAANARPLFDPADEVGVLTVLGDDREAAIVAQAIVDQNLAAHSSIARAPGPTPVQYIDHDMRGERLFVRYVAGVLADHRLSHAERVVLAKADVMIATVFTQILEFFETVAEAPAGGLRALDYCNLGTRSDPLAYARRFARRFDLGFVGLDVRDADVIDALEGIAREAGRMFIVTLAAAGSIAVGGPERVVCPAGTVASVVDTTGAGDTFAAGFLAAYARSPDIAAAMRAGSKAAAATLGRVGAFPAALTPWPTT